MDIAGAYSILQLAVGAGEADVQTAYRRQANKWHPDRWLLPGERAIAAERFKELGEAYERLRSVPRIAVSQSPNRSNGSAAEAMRADGPPTINAWDMLKPLERSSPVIYFFVDFLALPFGIFMVMGAIPLMYLLPLLRRAPRFQALVMTFWLRILPITALLWFGIRVIRTSGHFIGWACLVSGCFQLALEITAQFVGWRRLRRDASATAAALATFSRAGA